MIPRKKKIRLSLPPLPAPPPFKDFLLVAKSTFLSRTPPSSFQRCQLARSTAGRYTQSGIFQILCLTCRNCHAKCCGTLTEVIQMWHFFRGSLFGICCWLRAGWQHCSLSSSRHEIPSSVAALTQEQWRKKKLRFHRSKKKKLWFHGKSKTLVQFGELKWLICVASSSKKYTYLSVVDNVVPH